MPSLDDRKPTSFLTHNFLESILQAIDQEIKSSRRKTTTRTMEIDGIEHLQNNGGRFVYRILLSSPVNFVADQVLQFRTRDAEKISATVVSSDDEGMIVETDQPLPSDASLIKFTFDPAFIYRALAEYLSRATPTAIAREFLKQELSPIPNVRSSARVDLNADQSAAIDEMKSVPIHLFWGPPGTGKTTTLGVAVSEWLRQGKSVLVVSTSNAAVDVAMRSVLKRVEPRQREQLLRLGTSLDREVSDITISGKLRRVDYKIVAAARQAQDRLSILSDQLSHRTNSNERFQQLFAEMVQLEAIVGEANRKAAELLPRIFPKVRVIGCTLAKMVLDEQVCGRKFDVVVVDEVSMVSLVYALTASTLANSHLVFAGDPQQLPPICQSREPEAQQWFGENCYDWFGVGRLKVGTEPKRYSILRTQYRMTNEIGSVVSSLSYGNMLAHGRGVIGSRVEFIDVPSEWQTSYYSVSEGSYFHLSSIPIIHELAEVLADQDELLLLTPFRPQRSLLAALGFDLQLRFPKLRVTASTIHRSQGSESQAVIVDLTTHRPDKPVAFFRDKQFANLFNVGISRAKEHLIIVGSQAMLRSVAREQTSWGGLLDELGGQINLLPAGEILDDPIDDAALGRMVADSQVDDAPSLYSCPADSRPGEQLLTTLKTTRATRKLLVLPQRTRGVDDSQMVVRHGDEMPSVFMANGYVAVPYQRKWLPVFSPNVSRVLWRIAFSHLADEEVNPLQAKRFFCPECATGELVLRRFASEGWFLVCSNGRAFECPYRRRLSVEDAKLKVRMTGMQCPSGHPLTARRGGRDIFLGCENYPECDYTERLSLLDGV